MEVLIRSIESEFISYFSRLHELYVVCSGGTGKQTGEAVATHLHNIVERVKRLEDASSSFAASVGHTSALRPISFCSNSLPSPSVIDTKLASFSIELALVRSTILDLTSRIGQDVVEIGGVHSSH